MLSFKNNLLRLIGHVPDSTPVKAGNHLGICVGQPDRQILLRKSGQQNLFVLSEQGCKNQNSQRPAVVCAVPSMWHQGSNNKAHKWHFEIKFILVSISLCFTVIYTGDCQVNWVLCIHHIPQSPQLLEQHESPYWALVSLCAPALRETTDV